MNPTEVQRRFEESNRALRNQDVSGLLAGARGDPELERRDPAEVQKIIEQNNQAAQQAQAEVRAAANQRNTVIGPDVSTQEGAPVFVQQNPDDPIPEAPLQQQKQGPFTKPVSAPRKARPGESIAGADEVQFMKPSLASVQMTDYPGMAGARDVSDLNRARVSSIRVPKEAPPANIVPPTGQQMPGVAAYGHPARLAAPPVRVDEQPRYEETTSAPETNVPSVEQFAEDLQRAAGGDQIGSIEQVPDLLGLVVDVAKHLGQVQAAEYFGTTQMVVKKWIEGQAKPGIHHLQLVMTDPQWRYEPVVRSGVSILMKCSIEEGDYIFTSEKPKLPVMLACAIKGDLSPAVATSWMALVKRYDLNYALKTETLLGRARNSLVDMFLETNNEYLLMVDSDVILPFGNPGWYRDVTKWNNLSQTSFEMDTIPRLLSWRKDLVAGCYAGRALGLPMINQSDLNPKGGADKELANRIRKGMERGLVEQDWIPTGCMLIRRNVFEAIRKRFPNLAPQSKNSPWGWFNMEHDMGEDVSFCKRARQSGMKCYLDPQLVLAHIGKFAFGLEHTGPVRLQSM